MSHNWSSQLTEIQAALSAQNERFALVKEALGGLSRHASIELTDEWKNAFEETFEVAVEPTVEPVRPVQRGLAAPPAGSIRG